MKSTLILFVALTSMALPKKSVNFSFNLKSGDSVNMVTTTNQEINQVNMGVSTKSEMDMEFKSTLDFTEVNDKEIKIKQTYTAALLKMSSAAQGANENEDTSDNSKTSKLDDLVGLEVSYTISRADYKVSAISGVKEVSQAISDAGMVGSQIAEQITDESETQKIEGLFRGLASEGYTKNQKWEESEKTKSSGDRVTQYKVTKLSKKEFVYETESTTSLEDEKSQMGMDLVIKMDGTFTGEGILDADSGLISSYEASGSIKGDMTIKANSMMPTDMVVPMTIVQTSSVTIN